MTTVKAPDGTNFTLNFTAGLPPAGAGPTIFLMKDGSIHAGDLVWIDNALSPTGKSRVLRTTNPTGGLHEVFDVPESRIIGFAFAGAQSPFSRELASAY